ncbi:YjcZ family sporulation protein [Bacillus sp. SCS-153A]
MAPTAVSPAYTAPGYGYCTPARGYGDFVLIVVLFILLIIVGASFVPKC